MNGVLFKRTDVKGTDSNRFMWTAFSLMSGAEGLGTAVGVGI